MNKLLPYLIALILFPLLLWGASCEAQTTTTWKTQITPKVPVVVTTKESGNYIIFGIEGTTASNWVLKSALMKTQIQRDTVRIVLDPKKSADYIALSQTLAGKIDELSAANRERDRLLEQVADLQRNYSQAITVMKQLKAERAKYKQVIILYDTTQR